MNHCKIDPQASSREEIAAEINRLTVLMNLKKNEEQAIKIFINSVYGATASPFFVGYNVKVAEAITLQGQEMIKFVTKIVNRYFTEFWHRDKELHQKIGLTRVERITEEVAVYGDTDSCYITFQDVVHGTDWTKDPRVLIQEIYKHRLQDYLEKNFLQYGNNSGTDNIQNLEMETISYSAIFLKKKKYVMDKAWKSGEGNGITYLPQTKVDSKGVEMVQSSTPAFARKKLKELLIILFKERSKLNMRKFAELLKREKESFMLDNIENISMSSNCNDYEKGISEDRNKLVINSGCPMHVRAAGCHNFSLNASKWKGKYQLIKSGDKVRYYYAKGELGSQNVFAYLPGNYPVEFAPPVDYDMQFAKCIIDPINRFIAAMGLPPISSELIVKTQLF
jgi:DNA polymerase elongation subunit (family B)